MTKKTAFGMKLVQICIYWHNVYFFKSKIWTMKPGVLNIETSELVHHDYEMYKQRVSLN